MQPTFAEFLAIASCAVLLSSVVARAQTPAPNPLPDVSGPKPTVTREMGDLGGKFFGQPVDPAKARHYYVAAEYEMWDYLPQGRDVVCGTPLPVSLTMNRGRSKIRYVQYTDATFSAKVMPNPRLGILGPVLRGVVGDHLVVTFFNRTERPLSMHPHGAKYDKDSEGALYEPKPGLGSAVGPGAKFTYVWHLDESSGPLPNEPSSKCWLYHSHVSEAEEVQQGLVGFIIVTDPKRARPDGTPNDVDREMATLFLIFDESGLGEAEKEAAEYGIKNAEGGTGKTWAETQQMIEQGARAAINGYIFGNLPGLEMNEGERVRWYLFGLGSELDIHTAHWHGLRVVEEGYRRTDVVELLPATMKVADMVADNPGSWLFHCHVSDHMQEGMFASVVVHPKTGQQMSREPAAAFFGLPVAAQSLRIQRAEAAVDLTPGAANPCEIRLHGTVTVFEAFSIFVHQLEFHLGKTSVAFRPAANGRAVADTGSLRITNGGKFGVVYGGLMEFEATLRGQAWLDALKELGAVQSKGLLPETSVPLRVKVGSAEHAASIRILAGKK